MKIKKDQIAQLFFYLATLTVLIVAVTLEKSMLVYLKPLVPASLIVVYWVQSKKKTLWYPVSMVFIGITDVMVYIDFLGYFKYISITVTIFYFISSYLLKGYISFADIKISKLTALPVLISVVLIGYLIYSITELVWDKIAPVMLFFSFILIGVLFLVILCFFIFMADRYNGTINVFIAGCCCLIVDALLGINELSFYSKVFTVLINIAEIAGFYYFLKFLLEADVNRDQAKTNYYF